MKEATLSVSGLPEESFKKGEVILLEGEVGTKVYVLKSGVISVRSLDNELFRTDREGTILGEISVLLAGKHSASVYAEEDCTLWVIEDLVDYFDKRPEAAINVARTLASRVVNMNRHFVEIHQEIAKLQESGSKGMGSQLYKLMEKMDQFWGRDIFPAKAKS